MRREAAHELCAVELSPRCILKFYAPDIADRASSFIFEPESHNEIPYHYSELT